MPNLLDLNLQDNTEQGIFQSGDYGFYIAQNMIDAEAGGSNSILSMIELATGLCIQLTKHTNPDNSTESAVLIGKQVPMGFLGLVVSGDGTIRFFAPESSTGLNQGQVYWDGDTLKRVV